MGKTFKNFRPIRAAHMHRKLETGKRCICAFPQRLENGRYLPPIFRAIGLHVQKLNKKLTAYAEACEYPYGYIKGEDRMRDASPFIFPGLLITAWRERLWGQRSLSGHRVAAWGAASGSPVRSLWTKRASETRGLLDVPPLSHLRGYMKGAALARIIMHTMQQNRGASIASPPPPSLCEWGLMQNHLKQHMAAPGCAGRSHQKMDLI